MHVGVSDRQLRDARIAAPCGMEKFKVRKVQGRFASRAPGRSICFKVSMWFKVFVSHGPRQTLPSAEILEPWSAVSRGSRADLELVL